MNRSEEITLMLVEDDDVDVYALKRAISKSGLNNPIVRAIDGQDALEKLRGQNGQDRVEKPYIILLDINMPRLNGLEFLNELKKDPQLWDSVVFVLSTSNDEKDKQAAFKHGVAGYICKSDYEQGFGPIFEMLDRYQSTSIIPR